MNDSTDVVIVGAGIIGAACAFELARQNCSVTVVEKGGIASEATAAAMGHIVAMDDSEAQFALTRYAQKLWNEISTELPSNAVYERCGTIWIAADDEELSEVRRKHHFFGERGVRTEILDAQALRTAEPSLRTPLAGGLLVPGDAILHPPAAAKYFLLQAEKFGAKIRLGTGVSSIGNGTARLADGSVLSAKVIINATGHFAGKVTPGIPIRPRKGHLAIIDGFSGHVRHQLVELGYLKSAHLMSVDSVAFNVQPRGAGQLLVGSSRQFGSEHGEVEPEILARLLERAFEYLPDLKNLAVTRSWAGFRACTPDKLPLIGPWPPDPTVFLATGHEGLGITTSLATARLAADHILGRTPEISAEAYFPSRLSLQRVSQ